MRHMPLRFAAALVLTCGLLIPFAALFATVPTIQQVHIPIQWQALAASLLVAAAAASTAVALGFLFAVSACLARVPGASVIATLLVLAFACPATVWALGQVYCYGPGGLVERWLGIPWRSVLALNRGHYLSSALVLAEIHAPLAGLILARGVSRLHEAGIEAAAFQLRGCRFGKWLIGALERDIASAFLLCFALSAGNFAVPHVLQCQLYTIDIYQRASNYLDHHAAAWAALPLLLPALVATAILGRVIRESQPMAAAFHQRRYIWSSHSRWLLFVLLGLYLFISTLLPLAALVGECKSVNYFLTAVRESATEIENSVWIAGAAAVFACLMGIVTGMRSSARPNRILDCLTLIPIGIPPLLAGVAFASFFARSWPIDLTFVGDTSSLVILGLSFRTWPFAARLCSVGSSRFAPEWLQAASLAKLTTPRRLRFITVPLMFDYLLTSLIVAFVLAMGDVEISQMLCAPGSGTLALRLFSFIHFGPTYVAANLALLLALITAAPVWCYFIVLQRQAEVF